jgi:signal transduction histidine kinase
MVEIFFDTTFADFFVMIDKVRTQQILINLISNAIKFSHAGDRIKIEVLHEGPRSRDDPSLAFKFIVTDKGLGLNDLDRKNLFQPNFRSSDKANRACNANSNGLGLYTCKRLAQVLNGDLKLAEEYRQGCKFVFE